MPINKNKIISINKNFIDQTNFYGKTKKGNDDKLKEDSALDRKTKKFQPEKESEIILEEEEDDV